jgi:DNA mismatch repair ATPase MutL
MIECYALAFPGVRFHLVVGDRTRFDWPPARAENGGGSLALRRARAAAVWGERFAAQLLEAEAERDGIRVEALLGLPEHARATREGRSSSSTGGGSRARGCRARCGRPTAT